MIAVYIDNLLPSYKFIVCKYRAHLLRENIQLLLDIFRRIIILSKYVREEKCHQSSSKHIYTVKEIDWKKNCEKYHTKFNQDNLVRII